MNLKFGFFTQDLQEDGKGCLLVVPGSHKVQFPWGQAKNRDYFMQVPEVTPVRVKRGSAVLFHNAIWHSTDENTTEGFIRRMLYYTFVPSWCRLHDYIDPPQKLVDMVAAMDQPDRDVFEQLIDSKGLTGPEHYGPSAAYYPLLNLLY